MSGDELYRLSTAFWELDRRIAKAYYTFEAPARDDSCRPGAGDGYVFTAPVGSFPRGRSPFGVEDLAGNVREWVEDWFAAALYGRSPALHPVNRKPSGVKVIRGGGNNPWDLRSTLRHANPPNIGLSMVGFRCARRVRASSGLDPGLNGNLGRNFRPHRVRMRVCRKD